MSGALQEDARFSSEIHLGASGVRVLVGNLYVAGQLNSFPVN